MLRVMQRMYFAANAHILAQSPQNTCAWTGKWVSDPWGCECQSGTIRGAALSVCTLSPSLAPCIWTSQLGLLKGSKRTSWWSVNDLADDSSWDLLVPHTRSMSWHRPDIDLTTTWYWLLSSRDIQECGPKLWKEQTLIEHLCSSLLYP